MILQRSFLMAVCARSREVVEFQRIITAASASEGMIRSPCQNNTALKATARTYKISLFQEQVFMFNLSLVCRASISESYKYLGAYPSH